MDENISIDEENFLLRSRILQLEREKIELQSQVEQLKCIKNQLEQFILSMEQNMNEEDNKKKASKKTRKVSEYQKAFQEFYKNNRKNEDMLMRLRTRLRSLGMMEEADKLPRYIVRLECKKLFDEQQNANNIV